MKPVSLLSVLNYKGPRGEVLSASDSRPLFRQISGAMGQYLVDRDLFDKTRKIVKIKSTQPIQIRVALLLKNIALGVRTDGLKTRKLTWTGFKTREWITLNNMTLKRVHWTHRLLDLCNSESVDCNQEVQLSEQVRNQVIEVVQARLKGLSIRGCVCPIVLEDVRRRPRGSVSKDLTDYVQHSLGDCSGTPKVTISSDADPKLIVESVRVFVSKSS